MQNTINQQFMNEKSLSPELLIIGGSDLALDSHILPPTQASLNPVKI
jgi:hypothetical protein